MHIAKHGIVRRSLYAMFWGDDYATYEPREGGIIVGRRRDGLTIFIQPGDDANALRAELDAACAGRVIFGEAVDAILFKYEAIENWDSFEASRCAPSSDLGLLNYYGGGQ